MRNEIIGDRYLILDRLGEGGMAVVYTARDEKLGRVVAIKLLHQHYADDQNIRQRFELEAQAVSALDHPNIVKVFDYSGTESQQLWIVTELLKGQNVSAFSRSFDTNQVHSIIAACIGREMCKALGHAHSKEIVHRDIKPENIMITEIGQIKLMDFGIAKNLHKNSVTQTGAFMGSPSYMSPEQVRGKGIDHRCDIYSLGVLLYELLTGKLPYSGGSIHDVAMNIVEAKLVRPRKLNSKIPRDLNKIICKAMAADPDRRFQSAKVLSRELDLFLSRSGFSESNIELERFFHDRHHYEDKLAKLDLSANETKYRNTQFTNHEGLRDSKVAKNQSKHSRSTVDRNDRQTSSSRRIETNSLANSKHHQHTAMLNDQALNQSVSINTKAMKHSRSEASASRRLDRSIPTQLLPPKYSNSQHIGRQTKAWLPPLPEETDPVRYKQSQLARRRSRPRMPQYRNSVYQLLRSVKTAHDRNQKSQWIWGLILVTTLCSVGVMFHPQANQKIDQFVTQIKSALNSFQSNRQNTTTPPPRQITKDIQTPKKETATSQKRGETKNVPVQPAKTKTKIKSGKPKSGKAKNRANLNNKRTTAKKSSQKLNNSSRSKTDNNVARVQNPASSPRLKSPGYQQIPRASGRGNLAIRNSLPAVIFIDDKFVCRMPCSIDQLKLTAGSHQLRAERNGFKSFSKKLVIRANKTTNINLRFVSEEKFTLVFDWIDQSCKFVARPQNTSAQTKTKLMTPNNNRIDLPTGSYLLKIRCGKNKREITINNPGSGAVRYVSSPF
jgi:serine/threonine protein kinase